MGHLGCSSWSRYAERRVTIPNLVLLLGVPLWFWRWTFPPSVVHRQQLFYFLLTHWLIKKHVWFWLIAQCTAVSSRLRFETDLNSFNKFLSCLIFALKHFGSARFLLTNQRVPLTCYQLFSIFILLFGLVPILQCVPLSMALTALPPSSSNVHLDVRVCCAGRAWRPQGNRAVLWWARIRLRALVPRASLICSPHLFLVFNILGVLTVGDSPILRLSSSKGDAFNSVRLPTCLARL